MSIIESLSKQFNSQIALKLVRPDIQQLFVPLYHEDGDMVDIFLNENPQSNIIKVCDHGMTLMRLSYSYDLTPARERVLQRIISENGMQELNGNLYIDCTSENLYPTILQFAQGVAKVSSMRVHTKEMVRSMFYDMLSENILEQFSDFSFERNVTPIEDRSYLEVDYRIDTPHRPIFLYGVANSDKAKVVTISCQAFLLSGLKFTGWVVHENWDDLTNKDRTFLTNAVSKQFTTFQQFKLEGRRFLDSEAA